MIMQNNRISAKQIAEEISVSVRAVEKNIKELREKGILKRHGSARGGYWEISDGYSSVVTENNSDRK